MEVVTQPLDPDTIERQPKLNDPLETRIKQLLEEELLSTPWAQELFEQMRATQITFFKTALSTPDQHDDIRQPYLELLKQLSHEAKTTIIDGSSNLQGLDPAKGLIVVINHLGTAKLTAFSPSELGVEIPIDTIEPFPIRHAPIALIADQLDRPIFEAAIQLPTPLNQIQEAAGVVLVAAGGIGRLKQLESNSQKTLQGNKNALLVMYPEGGTTGKRNSGGPYDLEEFQSGAFVVAGHLNIPIIPVCQYFNPDTGFELGVLPVITVDNGNDKDYFKQIAKTTQDSMQAWLNSRKK